MNINPTQWKAIVAAAVVFVVAVVRIVFEFDFGVGV